VPGGGPGGRDYAVNQWLLAYQLGLGAGGKTSRLGMRGGSIPWVLSFEADHLCTPLMQCCVLIIRETKRSAWESTEPKVRECLYSGPSPERH
jgi:hypothetical protein